MTGTVAWLGIDWDGEAPAARLARPGSPGPARLVPLDGELGFRAAGLARYCTGWFDLTGPQARHVVCQTWERPDKGRQCRRCQYLEGFVVAHRRYGDPAEGMPGNLRDYLQRPHRLYLDVFADGTSKVGTVAEQRLAGRLSEQGPVAARYVARTADGLQARRLEAAVSAGLGLPQAVSTARKVRALAAPVDIAALEAALLGTAARFTALAGDLADAADWSPIDPPEAWRLPATSAAVFAAAPLDPYPQPLTSGEHSLHVRGLSGSIAACATAAGDGAARYAVNLAELSGAELAFGGEYRSSVPAEVQATLF